jgi:hypothetical protein
LPSPCQPLSRHGHLISIEQRGDMESYFVEAATGSGDRLFSGGQRLHHAWDASSGAA